MTDVLLALDAADADALAATASAHGHRVVARCGSAEGIAGSAPLVAGGVALVAADPLLLDADVVAACDRAGVRIVVVAAPRAARLARELGILDVVEPPVDWTALDARLPVEVDRAPGPDLAAGRGDPGRITVVWGPAGAPGRTSIAIALAGELAAAGRSTALADADTHAASVAPALGLLDEAPGFAAACRLAGLGSLDRQEFDRVAQTHRGPSGSFSVLTGLGRPSRWPELPADRVRATLDAARAWVDDTVVDVASSLEEDEELSSDLVAPRRNAATLAALSAADHVVVVGGADPVSLSRLIRAHVDLLDRVAPPLVSVVVNRVRASAIGLNPQTQVRQTLLRFGGIDDAVLVPLDVAAFDGALLGGTSLTDAAPRSAARLALRELVARRMLPAPARLERPRRERRRLGRALPA